MFVTGRWSYDLVDIIAKWMAQVGTRPVAQLTSVNGLISVLSAFMNSVGALALLMPGAIRMARRGGRPSSTFLMPFAFASLPIILLVWPLGI